MNEKKQIKWYMLAFMAFSTVWGFGNVANGFIYFHGNQVIFSWIFMFALYFVPYALMVGELGSAFKTSGGGVSSWIHETMSPKLAYYAGWTYWACHVTYIASKSSGGLKALSWAVFRDSKLYDHFPTIAVQAVTLVIFLFFCWVASKGLNPLKRMATLAGSSMFIMSILYIIMMYAAPAINPHAEFVHADMSLKALIPQFNVKYFTSLSILVFAVGGCEKISPYVNKVENPSKGFPRGMIMLALMVMVCAMLGTVAMGMMFDPAAVEADFDSYVANGSYRAFQKLGNYYHLGDALLIIYAICNMVGQLSTLVVSIDAPLRMLLDNEDSRKFIPSGLLKQNKNGAYSNGIKMVAILSGSIIVIQSVVPGAAAVLKQLTKLNSVCMPLRYLWVFVAYIALKRASDRFSADYKFVKGRSLGMIAGAWCFFITAACCFLGMYDKDPFTFALNVITPIVLTALGIILPMLARREQERAKG